MDGWMDGVDKCPCASLHTLMWVYEKGNTTSFLHFHIQADARSEPSAQSHAKSCNLVDRKKNQKFGGKKPSGN